MDTLLNRLAHICTAHGIQIIYLFGSRGLEYYHFLHGKTSPPPPGESDAVVQVDALGEGEIFKYQQGVYSAALDGKPWDTRFVNLWKMAVSADGSKLAAEVRLNLYDYTIAVNGVPWDKTFSCVWEPVFHPLRGSVVAPVRVQGKWTLAEDGRIIWEKRFVQVWHTQFSADGKKLAAIVAPRFGRWTVAVNEVPWQATFNEMVTDLVFSADGAASLLRSKTTDAGRSPWTDGPGRIHSTGCGNRCSHPTGDTLRLRFEIVVQLVGSEVLRQLRDELDRHQ